MSRLNMAEKNSDNFTITTPVPTALDTVYRLEITAQVQTPLPSMNAFDLKRNSRNAKSRLVQS